MSDVQSLEEQERHGLFHEEVQKLVDGLIDDIRAKKLTMRESARHQLASAVNVSAYTTDPELALVTIQQSTDLSVTTAIAALAIRVMCFIVFSELQTRTEYKQLPN